MTTWIFQGNPDKFDLDGYLAAELPTISWLVRQNRERLHVGDTVFIWRALGVHKAIGGVVAECRVASIVVERAADAASLPFWRSDHQAVEREDRVDLLVVRVAGPKEVIRRDWIKEDPILSNTLILRQAQGTNFYCRKRRRGA